MEPARSTSTGQPEPAKDLERQLVEEMAALYRRAEAYAERCRSVLERVEQDVIEWDTPSA